MLLQSGLCIVLPLSCHSVTNDARLFSSAFKLVRNNEMIKDRIKISSKEMQGKHGPGTRKVNLSGDKCKNPKSGYQVHYSGLQALLNSLMDKYLGCLHVPA